MNHSPRSFGVGQVSRRSESKTQRASGIRPRKHGLAVCLGGADPAAPPPQKNISPCKASSSPQRKDAFSLVRTQGRLPAAGVASTGLQRMGKSSPVPQPASSTKQKKVRAKPVIRQAGQPYTITDKRRIARKRNELKREIVKEVAEIMTRKGDLWTKVEEGDLKKAARMAIDLWEERR